MSDYTSTYLRKKSGANAAPSAQTSIVQSQEVEDLKSKIIILNDTLQFVTEGLNDVAKSGSLLMSVIINRSSAEVKALCGLIQAHNLTEEPNLTQWAGICKTYNETD